MKADLKVESCGPRTRAKGTPRVSGSLRFKNGLATLGLRLAAAPGAALLRIVRLRLPAGLRPSRTGPDKSVLLPRADGRRLSRKSFHLRRTKLTVSLRGAGSMRLNWRRLRPSTQLLRALNARRTTTRLTFNLRVTDARGATHALRPSLRIRA